LGRGHTSKGKGGKGSEREREGGKGRIERGVWVRKGVASSLFNFWLRA